MPGQVDGRRARGDATRLRAARRAADVATVSGLDSISIGRLAEDTGLSKSGILTVFPSREAVQLAAVAAAREVVVAEVVTPVWELPPGRARLEGLVVSWFAYIERGVFPGGCFLAAIGTEYAGRAGEVADAVRGLKREWLRLLEREVATALGGGPGVRRAAAATVFRLDGLMLAANQRFHLLEDPAELRLGRVLCLELVRELPDPGPAA